MPARTAIKPNLGPDHSRPLPAAGAALVRLSHVGKRFSNGTLAVQDLNLELRRGEFVSLLGASGCGKSTALRLIAGLTAVSSGTVAWPAASADMSLGFVFQEPTLMPWRSVFANVRLPLQVEGIPRGVAMPRVRSALALTTATVQPDARPSAADVTVIVGRDYAATSLVPEPAAATK